MSSTGLEHAEQILDAARIDVEDLAQNFLGLDVLIDDLSSFDKQAHAVVFGHIRPTARTITVCTRALDYLPLYRSTVLHEVAHFVLHGGTDKALRYAPGSPIRPPEERQADWFMSETLLPKPIQYTAVVVAAEISGLAPGDAFAAANTEYGRFQWRRFYFPFFINRMCLSRQLVSVRMSQQRHFDSDTFRYHQKYALPNRWRNSSHRETLDFGALLPPDNPGLQKIISCWDGSLPKHIRSRCRLDSFFNGTLTILVDSAARSYEVRLLLEAGLKELLTEAGTEANLKRIRIRVGKVS
jgi:hypothetical protein